MNTKSKVFSAVTLVALFIAFIGYYFSLYNGTENKVSTYTNLILIFACASSALFNKKNFENKILDTLVKLNGVLLVIWIITVVVQLFM